MAAGNKAQEFFISKVISLRQVTSGVGCWLYKLTD